MTEQQPIDNVTALLIRAQQFMINAGYRYAQASADFWPKSMVEMTKQEWVQVIAPFVPGQLDAVREAWGKLRGEAGIAPGLLLVGELAVDDPQVQGFLREARGPVAYIDAAHGEHVLRGVGILKSPPRILRHSHLENILRPRGDEEYLGVDCRSTLAKDLVESAQVAEFLDQAHAMAGKPRYRFTDLVLYACIAMYGLMIWYGGPYTRSSLTPTADILIGYGALKGSLVAWGEYWRLITCSFLHINLAHLIFNMLALVYFGRPLEIFQGVGRTAIFYFFAVITASLASLWWNPAVLSAGASGGLFGLLGVMLGMLMRHRQDIPAVVRTDLRRWVVSILAFNAVWIFMPGHVDNAAHLGGFLGGLAISLIASRSPRKLAPLPKWSYAALLVLLAVTAAFGAITIGRLR